MANSKTSASAAKKTSSPKTARKTKKPPSDETDDAPEITGSQQDYERFLPEARALAERDVRPFRLEASLAFHNVQRGVDALLPLADRIRDELPRVDEEQLRSLPALALALCFAASQVDRSGSTSRQLAEPLRRAYTLRETLLTSALALAAAGLIPGPAVQKIQKGRGSLDAAQDCVDLAALFHKHAAAIRGKTPVTAAHITEAAALGTDLLKRLRPSSAKRDRAPTGALKEAIDTRDRLATLVATRHELARRIAHWFWGDAADEHVPALQARAQTKRESATQLKKKPEEKNKKDDA